MVLLKNDGVLPLRPESRKIAVVGPLAASLHVLEGNYSGTPSRATTALDGIRKQFAKSEFRTHPAQIFFLKITLCPLPRCPTSAAEPGLKTEYFSDRISKAHRK